MSGGGHDMVADVAVTALLMLRIGIQLSPIPVRLSLRLLQPESPMDMPGGSSPTFRLVRGSMSRGDCYKIHMGR